MVVGVDDLRHPGPEHEPKVLPETKSEELVVVEGQAELVMGMLNGLYS